MKIANKGEILWEFRQNQMFCEINTNGEFTSAKWGAIMKSYDYVLL